MPVAAARRVMLAAICALAAVAGTAEETYQKPPAEVLEILNAPVPPEVSLSPTRDRLLLIERVRYPSIEEISRPMLPLAGVRINPANNGPHFTPQNTGLMVQAIKGGDMRRIKLPAEARIETPLWSPDGNQAAFAMYHADRIELWVADVSTARAWKLNAVQLNDTMGSAFQWMPDSQTLLCRMVPAERGKAPSAPTAPTGPNVQESFGNSAPARTHQDLLKNAHDDALFEYYFTSQMTLVNAVTGRKTKVGAPGLYGMFDPAPGGQYFLVTTLRKPFPRLLTVSGFAREVEVWGKSGGKVYSVASLPTHEGVPIEGVLTGPRQYRWRPTADATLTWVEALDGGDPKKKAPYRDKLMVIEAPFKTPPKEVARFEHRFAGLTWGEKDGMALISDYDRERRWMRTMLVELDRESVPKLIWERSVRDRYRDPGSPLMRRLPNGESVIWQTGDDIFLSGGGASPAGDYPFLDRFNLKTKKSERLFQCAPGSYESVVAIVSDAGALSFMTRHETPSAPPNYLLRSGELRVALTHFQDPTPQLRQVRRRLVTYQRADGVPLSFTLYLPAGYKEGTRLPTVMWAYPLEFNDADTAGQVSGSTNRFTTIRGASHLFFLTQGYAVLDSATMPIVGSPETMNDTFIEQIVASAKAAIDKAAELGVTDPERVGVGGHSYGAFMTANLLAHSRLFRAGIARSGAYNRTLTPFGFQGERRTFWEAPEAYSRLSPFMFARQIKDPLLLIHGEMDDNDGTFPIQSQRLFQAIKGNGGNARYVTLPNEAHGYAARESIEHVIYEMLTWFDKNVKHAAPRASQADTVVP